MDPLKGLSLEPQGSFNQTLGTIAMNKSAAKLIFCYVVCFNPFSSNIIWIWALAIQCIAYL